MGIGTYTRQRLGRFCVYTPPLTLLSLSLQLVLVDIHQDWCGVCDALHPTLQRVMQDYDMCSERMTICSASIAALGEQLQKALPSDAAVVLDKNGCLPLFALFRFKTCVAAISGVDAPSLLSAIAINMPDKPAPVAVAASE